VLHAVAIARGNGYAYTVDAADAHSIFKTGQDEKSYARDGPKYRFVFGVDKKGEACNLKFFRQEISKPGTGSSTLHGSYASVSLPACKCQ
jgi:hypothetical protein